MTPCFSVIARIAAQFVTIYNSNAKKLYNGISKGKILNYGLPRDSNESLAMTQMLKTKIFNYFY